MRAIYLSAVLSLLAWSGISAQQSETPDGGLFLAVAEYAFTEMIAEPHERAIVIDPSVLAASLFGRSGDVNSRTTWPGGAVRGLAKRYNARVGSLEDHQSCDETRPGRHCFLHDVDVVVVFGAPHLHGDEGTVVVRLISRSTGLKDSRQSFLMEKLLEVRKGHDGWKVVGVKAVGVTD